MTRTIALLLVLCAALFAGTASASAASSCATLGPFDPGATLAGDDFQGGDGDQCSPADGGPSGLAATDWHDLTDADLSGDNGAILTDNSTAVGDLGLLGNDPSVFGCQTA